MKKLLQIVFISIFCSILFLFPVKAENFNPIEVTCTQMELTIEADTKRIVKCICNRENVSEQIMDGSDFLINWIEDEINEDISIKGGYLVNNIDLIKGTRDSSFVTNVETFSQQLFITVKN